jgi:hypothetical protein
LHLGRTLVLFGLAVTLWAQDTAPYQGPAVLTRGQAPAAMSGPQVDFRPFVEVTAVYDTGLAGVILNDQGQLATTTAAGVEVAGGISGTHSWEHTAISVDYRGAVRHYDRQTYYDGTDQSLRLGVTHRLTRHTTLSVHESGGLFSRDFGIFGLPTTIPYDPASSYIPSTDFFDNRTYYLDTQADLTIQQTARLSFDFGGDGFLARRRSTALYGVTGASARGDMQYRISKRTTIGAAYLYTHFDFTRVFSGTDLHSFVGSYAMRLNRSTEFTAFAGIMRAETKFINTVPLDPVVAALLGQTQGNVIAYNVYLLPTFSGRLSETVHNGVLFAGATRTVNPGNGLFLTSRVTSAFGGYTFTGLRRWSFGLEFSSDLAKSVANVTGDYNDYGGALRTSRQISRAVHAIAIISARRYSSPSFIGYNRPIYDARIGFGFSPGDVPLRLW